MAYTPPAGNIVNFITEGYTLPSSSAVNFDLSEISGPANLKSYNTNLKANIKSINGNPIANVKSLNTNV